MLANRVKTILPKPTYEEILEITKIYSIAGLINDKLITQIPFRTPHHTISPTSLVGGGRKPKPGEISLAHYGILFLDEITEFQKSTIEALREPLEDKQIIINRLHASVKYPCDFMLGISMNPCSCGYYGTEKCRCTNESIKRYLNKISGALLDRIDIQVEMESINYKKIFKKNNEETSEQIRKRIERARRIQLERYKKETILYNSDLKPKMIDKYCRLSGKCREILDKTANTLELSMRAYEKLIKVARTIADLQEQDEIKEEHILEAIQYRNLDKKFFNKGEKC